MRTERNSVSQHCQLRILPLLLHSTMEAGFPKIEYVLFDMDGKPS